PSSTSFQPKDNESENEEIRYFPEASKCNGDRDRCEVDGDDRRPIHDHRVGRQDMEDQRRDCGGQVRMVGAKT
ncbi:MAG: hypothetical protein U1A06_15205, partial [Hoeflea sp.]|nr:hypothetical protein [Hoeflea sp.]